MRCILFSFFALLNAAGIYAQQQFTHADTLRGSLSPLRSCYKVNYYDLDLKVDIDSQFISGQNMICFKALQDFDRMQMDLFANMKVDGIYLLHDTMIMPLRIVPAYDSLHYTRDGNAIFVDFKTPVKKGSRDSILIAYGGHPVVAKHPPWDGGFIWSKDKDGNPWVGVACEDIGASLWWPCKDHLSDKPDSMRLRISVPDGLMEVSNGRYLGQGQYSITHRGDTTDPKKLQKWDDYNWFISYPINNYNVTLNIGKYAHFKDTYVSGNDTLPLNYYVLQYNLDKAKEQFKQVKPMLKCYEQYLGRYPFWRDGYKLVETPYLGMEHQSAISYGNDYQSGYAGMDYSGIGLKFDYIIIHESAHEWWGNNVSVADLADMWIHEGFASYTESIYVGCMFDSVTVLKYINAKKRLVLNDKPIIGPYGVNYEGDGDMYCKGMLMLNTLRFVINNDSLWWSILRGLQKDFSEKPTNTDAIVAYFNRKTGQNLTPIFDEYLRHAAIPVFQYTFVKGRHKKLVLVYNWKADVEAFNMPVMVTVGKGKYRLLYPRADGGVQLEPLDTKNEKDFQVDDQHYYINVARVPALAGNQRW